ncbi:VOC family protein [Paenibacillus taiwanensis]|uniref:VOC family protein n=1 Tax=Paenibacillus taiwanensis TaxID=401638 RepID=UPI00040C02F4|nr:VOC family protein [Paenibacillus taiwanensis]
MINHIATAAVYVADQQRAKAFWVEKIGFKVVAEYPMGPYATWLEVGPEGAMSGLVIYPRALMDDWHESRPSIQFLCDDVQAAYQTLKARGVVFQGKPQQMQWGTYATFQDEDGNSFLLKQ